jgi:hypothetical protein
MISLARAIVGFVAGGGSASTSVGCGAAAGVTASAVVAVPTKAIAAMASIVAMRRPVRAVTVCDMGNLLTSFA